MFSINRATIMNLSRALLLLLLSTAVAACVTSPDVETPEERDRRIGDSIAQVTAAKRYGDTATNIFHRPGCSALPSRGPDRIFVNGDAANAAGFAPHVGVSTCNP
jgi:hypothetical protein